MKSTKYSIPLRVAFAMATRRLWHPLSSSSLAHALAESALATERGLDGRSACLANGVHEVWDSAPWAKHFRVRLPGQCALLGAGV